MSQFASNAPTESHRFYLKDTAHCQAHLENEGYVVLRSVVPTPADVENSRDKYWAAIEATYPGVERSIPSTWQHFPNDVRGFLIDGRITHCEAAWYLRTLPAVKEAFAAIWGTDELLVSMDATIAWRPWWLDKKDGSGDASLRASWRPSTEGLHLDQNPKK